MDLAGDRGHPVHLARPDPARTRALWTGIPDAAFAVAVFSAILAGAWLLGGGKAVVHLAVALPVAGALGYLGLPLVGDSGVGIFVVLGATMLVSDVLGRRAAGRHARATAGRP